MEPTTDFLTRHAEDFDLFTATFDLSRSPYNEGFPDYRNKHAAMEKIVGVSEFLWCIEPEHRQDRWKTFEFCKPVEWTLRVGRDRILGYVNTDVWFAFLRGDSPVLGKCFTKSRPTSCCFDVLLPFPLRRQEIISKRVYRVKTPHEFDLLKETDFTIERASAMTV